MQSRQARHVRDGCVKSIGCPARRGLECFGKSRLLQDGVSQMARGDVVIDREISVGYWAVPDFVIAFPLADEIATGFSEQLF